MDYFVTKLDGKASCLLYNDTIVVLKQQQQQQKHDVCQHYQTKHSL